MKDYLTPSQYAALEWAVGEAESWRGMFTGDPDPSTLAEFDQQIDKAKTALIIVREMNRQIKKGKAQ